MLCELVRDYISNLLFCVFVVSVPYIMYVGNAYPVPHAQPGRYLC
jgi:hypothetical protein